jgi:succinyl-CoA synthetase beta subunit
MNIHEYQAKDLFARFQIPVPQKTLCTTVEEVQQAVGRLAGSAVIKAQVLTGGRGKAGGIQIVRTADEAKDAAARILGMTIKGLPVDRVLVAEAIEIERECYMGLTTDRNSRSLALMLSGEGGVEIEEVARTAPDKIVKCPVDPSVGLFDFQARNLALALFNDIALVRKAVAIVQKLYRCYVAIDASLAEINPLVITPERELIALDAKINLDDNALYRHPDLAALREPTAAEQKELDARQKGLSYIKLDGDIGCMVNGAGLAMATMDVIKLYGGQPANFLDIGGSSNPQKVVDAMNILLSDTNVKVVLINIFGGITRCDDVAHGLLTAMEQLQIERPIVVRLTGTNEAAGHALLQDSELTVVTSMREAARQAIAAIQK